MASPDGNVGVQPTPGSGGSTGTGVKTPTGGGGGGTPSYTDSRSKWSADLLKALGYPVTAANVKFLNAWQQAEGTRASYNPLATTQYWDGASSFNSVNVRNYASYKDGIAATVKTLRNGRYGAILSALKAGNNAVAAATAVKNSPWGTGGGVLRVLGAPGGGGAGDSQALSGGGGTYSGGGSDGGNVQPDLTFKSLDDYQLSKAMIKANPELWKLWQKAVANDWDADRFAHAVKNTNWYKNHTSNQRNAIYLRTTDPAEYEKQLGDRILAVKQLAAEGGAKLDASQIEKIATRALNQGWDEAQLRATLANYITFASGSLSGNAGETEDYLRKYASDMGVRVGDNWIVKQAQALFAGTSSMEAAKDYIDRVAISSFPGLADQIHSGTTLRDAASPYLQGMANILEINPEQVDLFDPTIRKALSSVNEKGNPALTPLWQFEAQLKKDPRWLKTNNARDDLMSTTRGLMQAWGVSI